MSYILDALKRADAERGGSASAAALPPDLKPPVPPSHRGRRGLPQGFVLLGAGLLLIAALTTWWLRRDRAPEQAVTPPASVTASPPVPAAPPQPRPQAADLAATPTPAAAPQKPAPFVGPRLPSAPILTPPAPGLSPGQQPPGMNNGTAQSMARGPALLPMQGLPIRPQESPAGEDSAASDTHEVHTASQKGTK